MLFGTLIFIKKSGGDGSKFPVTNKSLKIGRSDECVIRIQNPLISPEHCQLTVDDNGQAKIKNLSSTNPTVLKDQILGNGEFVLHHGDVFKLGERYARWEYQPTSKYYHQPSRSSQRLVAIVPPQERVSVGSDGGNSVNYNQALKRRYSERVGNSGNESVKKPLRRSLGAARGVPNKTKLISRHSLQLKRLAFSPQVKLRKSTNLESSGTSNASSGNRTPLRRSSTWEVKTVTPEKGKSPQTMGTNRKSTPIKMPMSRLSNESLIKSTIRSASKIPNLLTIAETSPPTVKITAARSLDDVPENLNLSTSLKSPMKIAKTPTPKKIKLMSPRKSLSMSNKNKSFSRSMLMDGVQVLSHEEHTPETRGKSQKFTPSDKGTLRKSILKKSVSQSDLEELVSSDEKGTPKKLPETPRNKRKSNLQPVIEISRIIKKVEVTNEMKNDTPKQAPVKSGRKSRSELLKSSPPSTPKYSERLSRGKKSIPSGVLSTPKEKENVKVSPRAKPMSGRKSGIAAASKTPPKRGTKLEFSAVASAERAAKKLKTIAPTKPDKNKKAALLVLGKASRKLKALPNTNVVIKQKIVKKAIKLSTKSQKRVKPVKKASPKRSISPKKGTIQDNKKSPVSSPEPSTSSRRHSTPNRKTSPKESSPSKKVTPDNAKARTPGRRSGKGLTSPVLHQSSSLEILNSSVPSKASDSKSVIISPNSKNTSFQYNSLVMYDPSRRVSKRLSSQNVRSPPDFTELTPTALGLTPKSIIPEFKSPKPMNRRSSSLVTPKNKAISGVVKSASTSKIHRKSVRFSGKDLNDSSFSDMNTTSGTIFDFDEIRTPNVTIDRFISPLSDQKAPKTPLKTQSSVIKNIQGDILRLQKETPVKTDSPSRSPSSRTSKTPVMETRSQKSPEQAKNAQKPQKSPKNDLTDVKGVRRLMMTPQLKKSPKNDLTDVKGVRLLMKTPQQKKSPKNDLTDVRGVKQLLGSPKQQKSPKNDLTDVRGVKRLMDPPKPQKSPKNDLTDVRGVKQLLGSPNTRRSPKNDLTDIRGVRRLMDKPISQKSPKNDLTDVRGVRRLMESPRPRKSPRNDLTDVTGVKQLLITKSPNNDLTNVSGLEALFKSPPNKIQCLRTLYNPVMKSPINDLRDVSDVRQLFSMNKENNSLDVSFTGVAELFLSPKKSETPRKRRRNATTSASATKVRVSDAESVDSKPTLRGAARSATKTVRATRVSRAAAIQSPIKSDEESPKIVKRATRSTRATKVEKVEVKGSRTKSEREVEVKDSGDEAAGETTTSRSTRATRKQPTKRSVEASKSPAPVKRTRKVALVEDKPSTPAKMSAASRSKKEPAKDVTPESKPSPIRTRRKSMARQSPKPVKRSTRAKASETVEEESRPKMKAKTTKGTVVSAVKTRQRKAKEVSPDVKQAKSSPVRTRRRAK